MARKTTYICDVTGQEVDTSSVYPITWDGESYDLHLSEEGRRKIEEFLAPILEDADEAKPVTRTTATNAELNKKIREWGRENGWEVKDRGIIASELREAYLNSNS